MVRLDVRLSSVVFAGNTIDIMLTYEQADDSSLFPYHIESLLIFILPSDLRHYRTI